MSGSLAARYIAGLPYDPSLGVGQYSRAPRAPAPGVTTTPPAMALGQTDATGQAVRVPAAATTVATGGAGAASGGGDMLLAAALGLLPYLPDAYSAISDLVSPAQAPATQSETLPTPPEQMPPPEIPNTTAYGMSDQYGQLWGAPVAGQDGLHSLYDGQGRSLGSIDLMQGADDFGDLGAIDPDLLGGNSAGDGAGFGVGDAAGTSGWFNNPLGLPAEAMTVSDMGLGSVGGIDIANSLAYAPAAVFAMGTPAFAKPGGELGGQIGTGIGTAIGGLIGGPWGAAAGAVAGGAIGGQIGPAPTVGRNFSSIGTFGGDGGLSWGNSGGDNGASAADADPFANWFSQNLQQQAAAQGLAFNPNMAGAQIRVGGYDNFDRTGISPAGGYFYDITNQGGTFGGSPEQYALRPSDDFASDPFSARQADAFTANVLADLASRNVFTPGGAATGGQGDLMGTLGTGYGWYGGLGSDYSQIEYGGSGGFNDILGGRQNAITGYMNDQQQQARQAAAVANTAQGFTDQGYVPAAFDLSQPIWFNGGIVNPGDILFPTQAASQNPWSAVGVDAGLIDPGLFGQQADGGA